jgi:hypothetical protein
MKAKPKKCKECGNTFTPQYSTLQVVCGPVCAIAKAKKATATKAKKIDQAARNEKRAWYNKNDLAGNKAKLQLTINQIAREIDRGLPCLATGNFGKMAGGHVYSRGSHTQMRYNLHNIHRQSFSSNSKQTHDGLMQEKLADEYGPDYLEFLRERRGDAVVKYTAQQYHEFHLAGLKVLKRLKKLDDIAFSKPVQRKRLRSDINLELKIYEEIQCKA